MLIALAIGYEAFIRLSSTAQPGMVKRGFHSTGMAGALACALERGNYGFEDMDPPRLTEEILRLIDCIEMIPDESMEDREKGIRGTRVEIRKTDSTVLCETVLTPKGDPENPLTREDILRKLRVCAGTQADDESLNLLVRAVDGIGGNDILLIRCC